jgi:CRISPR-associated endonuclease/helicase Cas3
MSFEYLLAKSWKPDSGRTPPDHARLPNHLLAVQSAAEAIVDVCGETILANLDLPIERWLARLRLAVALAALLHDLGKANSYFHRMVRGDKGHPSTAQPIRHELISALILLHNIGGFSDWVRQRIDASKQTDVASELLKSIIGAVAGHHVKLDSEWTKAFPVDQGGGHTEITLYLGHADLARVFDNQAQRSNETWSLLPSDPSYPGRLKTDFDLENLDWLDDLAARPDWRRFAAAVKALTVAADVAGSALLPTSVPIADWVGSALRHRPTAEQLRGVVAARLGGLSLRPFQQAIGESQARITLVEAGCGTGKTVAAYAWAAQHARGRKLFFCYPTTGTATEGFLGYVAESQIEAELIHSRAMVDLEGIATTQEQDRSDATLRIDSLNAWAPQAVACTIDTLLALPRNNRRGLYSSPAILSGCFVLDEIHAYDDEMLAATVAFIQALPGAPFLLMTASLPAPRKAFLQRHLAEIGSVPAPAALERIPRYIIHQAIQEDAFEQAKRLVLQEKGVLWVCNVVTRAQALFDRAAGEGLPVVTYHSRFRYQDRVARHRDVITGFSDNSNTGLLAITTQVAEMSLDLDAWHLVTEDAPPPAFIQRLGRLNRRVSEEAPGEPRVAIIVEPENKAPYEPADWEGTENWLHGLLDRPICQRELSERLEQISSIWPGRLDMRTAWLDSGWCAMPQPIREAGFNVDVILAEDLAICRDSGIERIKRTLPMPYQPRMEHWGTLHGRFVAPTGVIDYDEHRGATWAD